nr:carboxypeptidase regulatory-like domain-containing protein [Micromonospora sp. DSM 115978]
MQRSPRAGRTLRSRRTTIATVLLLLLSLVTSALGIVSPAAAADRSAPIDRAVLAQLARTEQVTVWIVMQEKADLRPAYAIQDRTARGAFVVDRLRQTAEQSQVGLHALLTKRRLSYQSYWIFNAIRVTTDEALIRDITADPNVERILPVRTHQIPKPVPGTARDGSPGTPGIDTVEWNIDRVRAPEVWSTFGDRGEGIVVANIDTGVQFDHPALVRQYRGNLGGATFDHNYNWFDPSNACGSPSLTPCDNIFHGTHTMGTMTGDDGSPGANQIGVAPGARWISAKGCETDSCSDAALLASAQWILAPTDLNGQNPRPDLRPHVVNNSWGSSAGGQMWYQAAVQAWVASGIFPAFSNGNAGPSCDTSRSPGDYVESYSAGAFDIDNTIADFSSRGSAGGEIKPNISAPGVDVRSSIPGNGYGVYSGTSMASPHVAATVALVWSAAPTLVGDIAGTRALLDSTATDVPDLTCGGTAADNNVWGEGRLDAFAAVQQAPRGPTGVLRGTVTNAGDSTPVSGATVAITGPVDRTITTDGTGGYAAVLPVGTYRLTATAFGFHPQPVDGLTVEADATTVQDLALQPAPTHAVAGHVRDVHGAALPNATVTLLGTPVPPSSTDANGFYQFPSVPEGQYIVRATAGNCTDQVDQSLTVDGDETLDFVNPQRSDAFGHLCELPEPDYVEVDTVLALDGDDNATEVPLPFPFAFYGHAYQTSYVTTNGYLNFLAPHVEYTNGSIPSSEPPNAAIYPYWDDLYVDDAASVRTGVLGSAPDRIFVIEWRNVTFYADPSRRVDFEILLHENGSIRFEYRNINNDSRDRGGLASIGIENESGTVGLQYSYNQEALGAPTFAVLFHLPPGGFVQGTVTDRNDGQPVAGATVRALSEEVVVSSTTTDTDGSYRLRLPLDSYRIEATANNYLTRAAFVTLTEENEVVERNFALPTARATVTPTSFEVVVPSGQSRTRALTLGNTGSSRMTWQTTSSASWLTASPDSGTLAAGRTRSIRLHTDSGGLVAGVYEATITLRTSSGRQPELHIPVRLIVPAYYQAVNAGGREYTDRSGDLWAGDQRYARGHWGYTFARSTADRTTRPISRTVEDPLYQDNRTNPVEYRFDGLPAGIYEIDLRFAELGDRRPNTRLVDVVAENTLLLPAHDITGEVGNFAADQNVFHLQVTDGQLNLRFVQRRGFSLPTVSGIQVIHRPDR